MGTTGPEFFNIQIPDNDALLAGLLGIVLDGHTPNQAAIQAAIDYVHENTSEDDYGVVYFPPGQYIIDMGPAGLLGDPIGDASLYVPENVVLKFASGAVWNIQEGAIVEIQGGIEAGLYQIFSAASPSTTIGEEPVRLISRRIDEVYPEWWGATGYSSNTYVGPNLPVDCAPAIQSALNAAFRDRVHFELSPIPVVLTYTYNIESTLVVNAPTGPGSPTELVSDSH